MMPFPREYNKIPRIVRVSEGGYNDALKKIYAGKEGSKVMKGMDTLKDLMKVLKNCLSGICE